MGRRLALLIATYQYEDAGLRQLQAPARDAEALADVLRDPNIAGFEVNTLVNEPHHKVGEAIGDFYRDSKPGDLALLYFTGHGLKDDDGRLYLAMSNTRRNSLLFTALGAEQIDYAMAECRSRQKVLVLDCCYSGAFPAGHIAKADTEVHALEHFQGRGRTVLTASDATQYSFEGNRVHGGAAQSVFTRHLVAGMRDGSADLNGDGDITLDELYTYVYDRVVEEMPGQRPKRQDNVEGRTVIARNINWTLPAYLRNALGMPDELTAANPPPPRSPHPHAVVPPPVPPQPQPDAIATASQVLRPPGKVDPPAQSRTEPLAVGAGLLAILASALLSVGLFVASDGHLVNGLTFIPWYVCLAVLALAVGICMLRRTTRRLIGPGIMLGITTPALWGLIFLAGERALYVRVAPELFILGHVSLILAALCGALTLRGNPDARLTRAAPPEGQDWGVIILGGVGAAALIALSWQIRPRADIAGYDLGYEMENLSRAMLLAGVLAIAVPACAICTTRSPFQLTILIGWVGGAAAIFVFTCFFPTFWIANGFLFILAYGLTILLTAILVGRSTKIFMNNNPPRSVAR